MHNIDIMNYWIDSSDRDYEVMLILYENKKNSWSLFLGHLVIEKLLKGLFAKNNPQSPYPIKSHNLLLLSEKCNLELTPEQIERLQILTQFNIQARYDDYSDSFHQKCTNEYTARQITQIKEVRAWLKELLVKV